MTKRHKTCSAVSRLPLAGSPAKQEALSSSIFLCCFLAQPSAFQGSGVSPTLPGLKPAPSAHSAPAGALRFGPYEGNGSSLDGCSYSPFNGRSRQDAANKIGGHSADGGQPGVGRSDRAGGRQQEG